MWFIQLCSYLLEIIEGDGSDINMSPVSNYIISMQPKTKKNQKMLSFQILLKAKKNLIKALIKTTKIKIFKFNKYKNNMKKLGKTPSFYT